MNQNSFTLFEKWGNGGSERDFRLCDESGAEMKTKPDF